jgi:RHS repeat-associated protein
MRFIRIPLGIVVALWTVTAAAQSYKVYVEPVFIYTSSGLAVPPSPSLATEWSEIQSYVAGLSSGGTTLAAVNLHPDDTGDGPPYVTYDGIPAEYFYDRYYCSNGTCGTQHDWNFLTTTPTCPSGAAVVEESLPNKVEIVGCSITISNIRPAPKNCRTCFGNPIYAVNGQKMQVETDYSGLPGLNFTRTYRSTNGSFASVLTGNFVSNTAAAGTVSPSCASETFYYSGYGTGVYCASYISMYPYVNNGVPTYQLATSDGNSMGFSGQTNAITANADINERVTMLTVNGATEWQVNREDDSIEIYNAAGSLIQKTLRGGRTFTYTYSTSSTPSNIAPWAGLLLSQTDAFGHTLSWQYNATGQMSQMTDPAGGTYSYTYDGNNNLTGVTYPDRSSKTYWYNESVNTGGTNLPTALTGITDESAVRYATFQYNSSGRAVSTQHAGGVDTYTFNYTSPGSSATVTDPLGTSRTYQFTQSLSYDLDKNQTQPAASGSGNVTQSETYDANGNPASLTDYKGNVTNYVYNLTRNLETSRTEAYGTSSARTITTVWDPNWRQPDTITEPNRTTGFTYDSMGNVLTKMITDTTVTPNVSRTWTYTYDSYGRMLTAKGPRTDVNSTTTYAYYTCTTGSQCGQLQTVTDPVGNVTTYNTYNAHGQPLTITDPNGVVTTLTYDARTRLTSRQVGTETTSFSYYPTGLLKQVTLPDSSYVLYTYDGAHRLTQISDGAGNSIQYTLDAMGNRTATKTYDPSSVLHLTHTRVYNTLNELYQDVNAANTSAVTTTYSYDNNGNQTAIAAPLSRNTTDAYDPLNRLSQITDPNSGNTYFTYDTENDLTSVKDPRSLTTTYGYNGFGDILKLISPDTGTSSSTYDSGGNLSVATDARGSTANYTYDAANRVTQIVYKNSGGVADQTIVFGYDAGTNGKGRLTSASDANHSMSWSYDTHGRVTGKGLVVGSFNESVGYGYTNADLTALVTPSGQAVSYGYNSNHQVTSITVNGTAVISAVTYEPFGGVNGWTWGNSSTVSRSFNGDGLISQIVTAGVTLGYSFDNANRITGISDSSNSALTWAYGYDVLDRLTSATTSAIADGWTYDANGNRLTQTGTTGITFAVSSTSNQLTATSGGLVRSYGYDAAGNTQSNGAYSFAYNNRGRMASTNGASTLYLYNALGQMIEKSGTLGTTILMQDEAGHLIGEYTSTGGLIEETVWLGDIPIATLQPNGSGGVNIFYVHTDHLNTPRKVAQPSGGTLAWRWDTDPFGTTGANQNPAGLGTFVYNLRFPGQYSQAETGINQNYRRDFDPQVGRYVESDPIGLRGGINTYGYVRSSPVSRTDRTGLVDGWTDPSGPPDMIFPEVPCNCPLVPAHPQCANVDNNVNSASEHYNPFWFYNQVRNHGPWDYKQQGLQYDEFGNFNYGAAGAAFGFPDWLLLRMAGWAQQQAGTSLPQWGNPWGSPPYGDDPGGQDQIKNGINYARCHCGR